MLQSTIEEVFAPITIGIFLVLSGLLLLWFIRNEPIEYKNTPPGLVQILRAIYGPYLPKPGQGRSTMLGFMAVFLSYGAGITLQAWSDAIKSYEYSTDIDLFFDLPEADVLRWRTLINVESQSLTHVGKSILASISSEPYQRHYLNKFAACEHSARRRVFSAMTKDAGSMINSCADKISEKESFCTQIISDVYYESVNYAKQENDNLYQEYRSLSDKQNFYSSCHFITLRFMAVALIATIFLAIAKASGRLPICWKGDEQFNLRLVVRLICLLCIYVALMGTFGWSYANAGDEKYKRVFGGYRDRVVQYPRPESRMHEITETPTTANCERKVP